MKLLTSARPGVADQASEWIAAAQEAIGLADESGDLDLRVAIRGAGCYAHMCAGDLDLVERTVDEILELGDGDPAVGAGIVIGCPPAWALMARSIALKERDQIEEAERVADESLRLAAEYGDPETESWSRGNKSTLLAERGDLEAALSLARRNCELTDQLGDVFSRSLALTSLCYVQLAAGEYAEALETIELSDRIYREAMNVGGEGEAWRGTLRARALLGPGAPRRRWGRSKPRSRSRASGKCTGSSPAPSTASPRPGRRRASRESRTRWRRRPPSASGSATA